MIDEEKIDPEEDLEVTKVYKLDITKEDKANTIKKLIKDNKVTIGIISGIIVLLWCIFLISSSIMSSLNGKDKLTYKFNKDILNKNVYSIEKYLVSQDKSLKIDDEYINKLLYYMEKHPFYLESVINGLYEQSRGEDSGDNTFVLKKQGKKLFGFDRYVIQVNPSFITIYTNYKNTNLYVNNKFVGKSNQDNFSKEYGPFLPCEYSIEAVYKDKYIETKKQEKLNGFTVYNNKLNINVFVDAEYVTVHSNVKNTVLYINGKDTGLTISKNLSYGPVIFDGSVKMYVLKKTSKGINRSKEERVKSRDVYLPIENK